jgi:hypothetical protein
MKKALLFIAIVSVFTSCVKDAPQLVEQVKSTNFVITATDSTYGQGFDDRGFLSVKKFWIDNNSLMVGVWSAKNIGTVSDTLSTAEMTIKLSGGLQMSDIYAIKFSSQASTGGMMAWGAGITDVKTVNVFPPPPHNTFYVKINPYTDRLQAFTIFSLVTLKDGVKSGTVQIGLRMYNPRTGQYTTKDPIWARPVTFTE